MSIRNLDFFFRPKSVAVIGATDRPGSVGQILMKNLSTFQGTLYPVNPKHARFGDLKAYKSIADLPGIPELAIIATPPLSVPSLIAEVGKKGTKAAIVITAGFAEGGQSQGLRLQKEMLEAARPHTLRIIGPNCIGIQVPKANLNASFARQGSANGRVAFVTQSGAMATAVVDWAAGRGIGFSHVISLGDMSDVDFGDTLEQLASDGDAEAILLYIEAVTHPRKFMTAAQAAARKKPVIVVKAGRFAEGAKAAASHTGALAGSDKVYSAAFLRAGLLRVYELEELFEAVETLSKIKVPKGERLAILTNGGGAGVLATDALIEQGGKLAKISPRTIEKLNACLPTTWSHANPIDIVGDATADRYRNALEILLKDDEIDAILTLNCPTAIVDSAEVAEAVIKSSKGQKKSVLSVWLGGNAAQESRQRFEREGIPCFSTPGSGVRAFMHLVRYNQSQAALKTAISSARDSFRPDRDQVKKILERALLERREWLSEYESKQVLSAYAIQTTRAWLAKSPADVGRFAAEAGGLVAIKIHSPDIIHKSDIGGVVVGTRGSKESEAAAANMLRQISNKMPEARIEGFVVEDMISRPNSVELIVGMNEDAQFGPVLLFGEGGTAVEVIDDTALELPPLNRSLALEMISKTRVFRRLKGYRNHPAADMESIALALVNVSRLVEDFAEIIEIDINPLLADANGVVALDARMKIKAPAEPRHQRLCLPVLG